MNGEKLTGQIQYLKNQPYKIPSSLNLWISVFRIERVLYGCGSWLERLLEIKITPYLFL